MVRAGGISCCDTGCHWSICARVQAFSPLPYMTSVLLPTKGKIGNSVIRGEMMLMWDKSCVVEGEMEKERKLM